MKVKKKFENCLKFLKNIFWKYRFIILQRIVSPFTRYANYFSTVNNGEVVFLSADGQTDTQIKVSFNLHQKPFRMVYNT